MGVQGTVNYMPPEELDDESQNVDRASSGEESDDDYMVITLAN